MTILKTVRPPTSWSYSRFADYNQCPAKFAYKHLAKISEPSSPAMQRGTDIHTMAEGYTKGTLAKLPPELKNFKEEFTLLRKAYKSKKLPIVVEDNWAFTRQWVPTQWNDWNNCWVRIKLDLAHYTDPDGALIVTDWKTGKFSTWKLDEYLLQLSLYALAAFKLYPQLKRVEPRLGFLDAAAWHPAPESPLVYLRKDEATLQKDWERRVQPMFNDKRWAPKPNNNCKWCHYRKDNGGPCQY